MDVVYYSGDRIYFRPIELDDEPMLRRWINHPQIWSTLGHRSPMNGCREREWIQTLGKSGDSYHFGIAVKDGDCLIGTTGLHQISQPNRSAIFGIMIGEAKYQNRGYGTEATRLVLQYGFEQLNLNRITLSVYAHNLRAVRVYQKAGFKQEGARTAV